MLFICVYSSIDNLYCIINSYSDPDVSSGSDVICVYSCLFVFILILSWHFMFCHVLWLWPWSVPIDLIIDITNNIVVGVHTHPQWHSKGIASHSPPLRAVVAAWSLRESCGVSHRCETGCGNGDGYGKGYR